MKEKVLFKIFKEKEGLDLYEAVKVFVLEEKQQTAKEQFEARRYFIFSMLNIWNNAGWDDKKDWSRKLDVIRAELKKVSADRERMGIKGEED